MIVSKFYSAPHILVNYWLVNYWLVNYWLVNYWLVNIRRADMP
ncbi:hypothetical protein AGR3A_Cc290005 [Agrobacterium tomkonis CFBP 6623]|uniref:Uncharacterized protein n=1 Tax=Agrobacterium tomkonis CFBP 6623 TaxID=1183432 RepID=A0A1S7PRB0_9HYPH|nr:hypothetical protein AGR3A_Cc290005 [Agrobacterium tomkonis CFBP 6623]